jgi:hypothetical protein
LIAVGVIMALAKIGRQHETVIADAHQTVTQIKGAMAAGPGAKIEAGADAGPMTRLTAVVGNMILADTNDFSAASSEAGLAQVISLEGLTPDSPVLDHCERLDALGPRSRTIAARYPAYIDAARSEGAKLAAAKELPQAEVDAMIRGMSNQQQAFNRQWTLGGELAVQAGQLCRILSRRHWQNTGSAVRFTDEADLADATAVRSRLEPVMNEINALGIAARAKSAEAIRTLEAR